MSKSTNIYAVSMPGILTHVVKAKKGNSRFTFKIQYITYYKYVVRKLVLPDFIIMYFPLRVR